MKLEINVHKRHAMLLITGIALLTLFGFAYAQATVKTQGWHGARQLEIVEDWSLADALGSLGANQEICTEANINDPDSGCYRQPISNNPVDVWQGGDPLYYNGGRVEVLDNVFTVKSSSDPRVNFQSTAQRMWNLGVDKSSDSFKLVQSGGARGFDAEGSYGTPPVLLEVTPSGNIRGKNLLKTFVGATTGSYDGNLGGSNPDEYQQADGLCNAEYSGSRVCTAADFANGRPTQSGWYNTFTAIREDAPFGGSRINNDCLGWSSNDGNTYGASYWSHTGQNPATVSCSSSYKFLCCR